ncbi:MAG: hypothetical protein D6770_03825, partial [Anaerolineae bacterium]
PPTKKPYTGPPLIVFASNRGGNPQATELYLIDPQSGEITPLNTGVETAVLPSWSPDGSTIAFAQALKWHIYTVSADGSDLFQVTDFSSNNPDWAPDGSRLVFQSDARNEPKDTPDIYLIDPNGENLTEILDDPEPADFSPRWSPDGSRILFVSNRNGPYSIFLMDPDGANIEEVIPGGKSPVTYGAWSPDGERIAFVYGSGSRAEIYIVDKNGDPDTAVRLTKDDFQDSHPSWSPDGSQLVFASNRSGNWDLWLINADGSDLRQLTDDEYYDGDPDWGP